MGKKIIEYSQTADAIPEQPSRAEMPHFLPKFLMYTNIPAGLFMLHTYTSEFFSVGYTNGICLVYDWVGFLFAATGGVYFAFAALKYAENDEVLGKEWKQYMMSVFPVLSSIASMSVIYNLNLYAFGPIGFGLLNALYLDYRMCEDGSAPKYWLSFKFKYSIWSNIFLFMATMAILSFKDHQFSMKKMLEGYEIMVKDGLKIENEPEGEKKENTYLESKVPKEKGGKNISYLNRLLEDPSK